MKSWPIILALGVGGLCACGGTEETPDEVSAEELIEVLPTSDMLVVNYPGLSSAARSNTQARRPQSRSPEEASCEAADDEEVASLYKSGCNTAAFVNNVVTDVLTLLDTVTSYPPTQSESNAYIWGPFDTGDGTIKVFLMSKNDDGTYSYDIKGKLAGQDDAEYLDLIAGEVEAGAGATRNVGYFYISYDNMSALSESFNGGGVALYSYDRLDSETSVEAQMEDLLDEYGVAHNIVVDYDLSEDSSGSLRYGYTADIIVPEGEEQNATPQELIKLNTRWMSDGAGRADATVTEGDLGSATAYVSQCWNQSYLAVYDATYLQNTATLNEEGDPNACVFENPDFLD